MIRFRPCSWPDTGLIGTLDKGIRITITVSRVATPMLTDMLGKSPDRATARSQRQADPLGTGHRHQSPVSGQITRNSSPPVRATMSCAAARPDGARNPA